MTAATSTYMFHIMPKVLTPVVTGFDIMPPFPVILRTLKTRHSRAGRDCVFRVGVCNDATKGDIRIGQVKLTMPIKGGLVKIPVSFTWANRTELINESEKRGQIGLTLDLDSVFQGLH